MKYKLPHLKKSNLPTLKKIEFDILAKCVLFVQLMKGTDPPQPVTWEMCEGDDGFDMRKTRPWWLRRTNPLMMVIRTTEDKRKQKFLVCTWSNAILPGEEDYSRLSIYEDDLNKFSLSKILDETFPVITNRDSWTKAIVDYAKYLKSGINNIEFARAEPEDSWNFALVNGKMVNADLMYDVQIRARTMAFLKCRVSLYDHATNAQVSSVGGVDGWINLGQEWTATPPTMTSEMATLANFYGQAYSIQAEDPDTAIQKYQELLRIAPNFVAPRVNLSHLLRFGGQYQQALEQINIAIGYAPEDPDVWLTAGQIQQESILIF